MKPPVSKNNLELILAKNRQEKTICQHQYTSFPLRLSPVFRLEGEKSDRAYLYLINTSPGLLANDVLNLSLHLTENSQLYLTDQAATKVHQMPNFSTKAKINYQIIIENNSNLELVGEPIILYKDATLEQTTKIKLYPQGKLFFTEIILPGRLAKNEYYDFNSYCNRLEIVNDKDELLFINSSKLLGQNNFYKDNKLFTSLPIIGNGIAILPDTNLKSLINQLKTLSFSNSNQLETAISILPAENGIALRVLAKKTQDIKQYFSLVLKTIRQISGQATLPYIPK